MNAHVPPVDVSLRRRQIEAVIEHLISLLDTLDGEVDMEEGGDLEPYLADTAHDREDGDDNGIADDDGMLEQWPRVFDGQAAL